MPVLLRNSVDRFGWFARIAHWATVALIAIVFIDISGLDVPPKLAEREAVVAFHVSLGMVVLLLMLARLGWRVTNPNPVRAWNLSPGHRFFAISVHRLMYVVVIGLCLCGIAGVIAGGAPLDVFGLRLGAPEIAVQAAARALALDVHARLSTLLLIMIAVHATTAVVNQVFAGDEQPAP